MNKYILSLVVAILAAFSNVTAQERQMVINFHNSVKQYPVDEVLEVEFNQQLFPPAAVRCAVNGNSVVVSWSPSKGATSYTVQRSANSGSFVSVGTYTTTTFTDVSPVKGENRYRVIANGNIDSSEPSDVSKPAKFFITDLGETALYLGIIGFNDATKELPMQVLSKSNQTVFTSFVNSLTSNKGTLLYYSVDQALEMLTSNQLPSDLSTVAVVTFTDGLDQGSMMKTAEYSSQANYLNSINQRLLNTKINGKQIDAYAIGLRGTDVKDAQDFRNKLNYMASKPENAIEITNISQLNEKLNEIASKLSFTYVRDNIELKVSANPGTRIRFTFDALPQGKDAASSNLYIECTYKRYTDDKNNVHYILDDIKYHGITSSSGTTFEGQMSSTQDGIIFRFEDVKLDYGDPLSLDNYKRWSYDSSYSYWQLDSEGSEKLSPTSETVNKSGAIVLNLDCSTSLGSQFATVKNQANEFIKKLASKIYVHREAQTFTVNGVSFTMVPVSGGTFSMGSNDYSNEKPVHSVTLSDYMIGEAEVTQALWKAVMGSNPSAHKGDNLPVECVSWDDCQRFIEKLNSMTGQRFRLPTEAEWEYAARGGSGSKGYKYSGSDNLDSVAWYDGNSGNETHAVRTKAPNELGLYDMSGNVWEWCRDWYGSYPSGSQTDPAGPSAGSYRVHRGGSYRSDASSCRVANRRSYTPSFSSYSLGLRLVL